LSIFNLSLIAQTKEIKIHEASALSNEYSSSAEITGLDVLKTFHSEKGLNGLSEINPDIFPPSPSKYATYGINTKPDSLHGFQWDSSINDFYHHTKIYYEYIHDSLLTFTKTYYWDTDSLHWKNFYKQIRNYDENNNLIEQIIFANFSDQSDVWPDTSRTVFEYDENSNLIRRLQYIGMDQYWRKNNYEYNDIGVLTMEEELFFENNTNEWKGNWKNEYIFDESYYLQEEINYIWPPTLTNWIEWTKKYFYYDDENNNIETIWYQLSGAYDEDLEKFKKFTYGYDPDGNIIEETEYVYWSYINDWRENIKLTRVFDSAGNILEYVLYKYLDDYPDNWFAMETEVSEFNSHGNRTYFFITKRDLYEEEWQNVAESYYEYDDQQYLIKQTSYAWNFMDNEWIGSSKLIFTYDENYRLQKSETYLWDWDNNDWIPFYYILSFYSDPLYISQDHYFSAINVFPNPVKDKLNISGLAYESIISVFDLNGRLLIHEKSSSERDIVDVSNFKSGIYILEVRNGKSVQSIKFIKQ
jgi:hypothetical protein